MPGTQEVPLCNAHCVPRAFTSFGPHPKLVGRNKYFHFIDEGTEALSPAWGHKWQSWNQTQVCLIPEPSVRDQYLFNHLLIYLIIHPSIH